MLKYTNNLKLYPCFPQIAFFRVNLDFFDIVNRQRSDGGGGKIGFEAKSETCCREKRCIKTTSSITLPLLGEWIIDRTKKLAMIDLIKY